MDLRPSFDSAMDAFSVPVTIRRDYSEPISTRGIWINPTLESLPSGGELQRVELKRVMSLSKSEVPVLPSIGTEIDAPEFEGETVKTWKIDAPDIGADDQHHRVVLLEVVDC